MKIVDLTEEREQDYFICMEDWADYMKEAGSRKQEWYEYYKDKGLRVKLAINDEGLLAGFIQYIPIEHSIIDGEGLYFVLCIWVHGHTLGRGDLRKKGIGKELLKAAEEDVKQLGYHGLAVWGLSAPFWMQASWWEKFGYQKCDEDGMSVLLWKKFTADAVQPKWLRQKKSLVQTPGKVTISLFNYGWCPSQNVNHERTLALAKELGDLVIIHEYDTKEKSVMEEWGLSDALFVDDEMISNGPPLSAESIKEIIEKHLRG